MLLGEKGCLQATRPYKTTLVASARDGRDQPKLATVSRDLGWQTHVIQCNILSSTVIFRI